MMHKTIHFWNPYEKTNNLTLFSEKSEHVLIFEPISNQFDTIFREIGTSFNF